MFGGGPGAGTALEVGTATRALDGGLIACDVDGAVALGEFEDGKGVEGRGAFDVTGSGVEAGCMGNVVSEESWVKRAVGSRGR